MGVTVKADPNARASESSSKSPVSLRLVVAGIAPKMPPHCSICDLREVCFPCDLMLQGTGHGNPMVISDRCIKQGETLFRAGDDFHYLYTVRSGFFKTVQTLEDGREQVTGFQMSGDMLGADAIGPHFHGCTAVALEDSRVCAILYSHIDSLGDTMPELQHRLHMAMSSEIVREHSVMLLLGMMTAKERVAVFLLNLSQRLKARGYSPTEFVLRMTRRDVGSYLGLKLETVSRMISKFRDDGLVSAAQRHIRVLDLAGLKRCIKQVEN